VGASFLGKLFGRAAELPEAVRDALAELSRLTQERPALAGPARLLSDVLPGLYQEPVTETVPCLAPDQAAAKLAGGVALLRGETLAVDVAAFGRRWRHVCAAVERHQDGPAARALADAVQRGVLDARELTQEIVAGQPEAIYARADAQGLDADLTATVLRLTLFPVLCHAQEGLAGVRLGGWSHGYCPTCGSWPVLGEFRGLEQTRLLRCGLCAGEWEFPRLRCPFCDETDHRRLGYLHIEGEEGKYRAATCETCRRYVKMASTLGALSPPQVLVTDVATLHLDLAAAERAYGQGY
jgi:FdhE protein